MDASLTVGTTAFRHLHPPCPYLCLSIPTNLRPSNKFSRIAITPHKHKFTVITAASSSSSSSSDNPIPSRKPIPFISHIKTTAAAVVFAAAVFVKFQQLPSKAEISSPPANLVEELKGNDTQQEVHTREDSSNSPLNQLLESNSEAIDALKTLLQQKLDVGEDEESLNILKKLSSAQPENNEWKFLTARVLNEMGRIQEARDVFEEILEKNPLSFEALFENALLMDRSGEGEAVIKRLEEALRVAEEDNKAKEARDVKLIMAQVQFLQKNVEEALMSYEELVREDPNDFRPYFCKGMIYSLLDRNEEAREQFSKYRKLSPKKFEVEGYLRTPLSRMKLFGTDEGNSI
ncbi:SLOW GREEN 1, chloroplastic [Olea europaea subsp. europaea]|uniref:SLOW GREEN 1, chloroplastic n=1 Tax=Olea europaea subsp. europaea TaxID=158383 RepID=A0A8S0PFH9_OLEEU|nr:SLOW GREEN 1, chloroplastic [Olea europaea subsp. europaea]